MRRLDQWVAAGKLVLTIDYSRLPEQIDDAYSRARARGYVPFVTAVRWGNSSSTRGTNRIEDRFHYG
jgi:endo-alpha-1,4-polygalactosaminidase (GH114 family)